MALCLLRPRGCGGGLQRNRAAEPRTARQPSAARSRSWGSGPAPSRRRSRRSSTASKAEPGCRRQVHECRRQPADPALDRGRGRQPARPCSVAQPGLIKDFVDKGALKPMTSRGCGRLELRQVGRRHRHRQRQALRPPLQGRQQVDGLVQRRRVQGRRRDAAEDLARLPQGREHDEGSGVPRVLDRRRRTGGRSPTCSRTSTSARPGRQVRQARHPRDPVDRPVGDDGARRRWRRSSATTGNIAGGTSGALQTDFPTSVANVFSATSRRRPW